MITVTFYGSVTQEFAWLDFYLEVLASLHWVIYFSWNQSWMAMSLRTSKTQNMQLWGTWVSFFHFLKFVMNFLKGVVSICDSFRSTGQPSRINGSVRCFQVVDLYTACCHRVTPVLAKTQILSVISPIWGSKSPSRELLSPVWGLCWAPFGAYKARWGNK